MVLPLACIHFDDTLMAACKSGTKVLLIVSPFVAHLLDLRSGSAVDSAELHL